MCNIGRIGKLCEKDILTTLDQFSANFHRSADSGLPERKVEHMMQSERDQRTFYNTEDQCSEISGSCYQTAQCIDTVLHNRPYEIHCDSDEHISNC